MSEVKAIPDGYHVITPYLVVAGAAKAIDFYGRAFGAQERFRMPSADGSVMHAEFQIGDSIVMIADENPMMGSKSPEALGGSPQNLLIYVEDVDSVFQKALDEGASVVMPVADMFWGDRYGKLKDPFGHEWSIATHIEDVPPEEMGERAAAAMAEVPPQG